MSLGQYLGNHVMGLLPATRAFAAKRWLLRRMGFRIDASARVTSSVRVWGNLRLTVGMDTFLGHDVLITGGNATVMIGSYVDIAPRVTIVAGTHAVDMLGRHSAGAAYSQDIRIEDGVWIGAGAIILGGVTIGKKSIVAAGSTVTRDIPPYVMAAGAPCRPKKRWCIDGQRWLRVEAGKA
jgi:maltose O-acetyltransferase